MELPLLGALALAALVATGGAFIQRVTGFGFAIFAMIFMAALLPSFGEANLLCGMLSMCSTFFVALRMRRHIKWKKIIYPLIANFIITIPSVMLMKKLSDDFETAMKILLGAVLVLLSIWFLFFSKRFSVKESPASGLVCGGLGGIMGGLFSMGGPPIAFYLLETSRSDNLSYIASIQTYFFLSNIYGTVVKSVSGCLTKDVLMFAAVCLIGMAAGTVIGAKVFDRLSPQKLRLAVYGFMGVSGIVNIVAALV